jgi:nitric-oxide synthase
MPVPKDVLHSRAQAFILQAYNEMGKAELAESRLKEVLHEIEATGTYIHTQDELICGARMAWRNSNRCIGRLFWKSLKVVDARHVASAEEAVPFLSEHLSYGFNGGDIRSVITIFNQQFPGMTAGPRILNNQLISYAGHRQANGAVIGDPMRVSETDWFAKNGYRFQGHPFEVLPLAMQWPGDKIHITPIKLPEGITISLTHPDYPWFSSLGLEWYGLPVISDMLLEIGGVKYTAAPFNGWYMGTEIGSRNLCDAHRYNVLQLVAEKMGLDTASNWSLWRDRALVEVNRAVLYSFHQANVKISNHHDAAVQFMHFEETEIKKGRDIKADWTWIVPPLSSSVTPVFHKDFANEVVGPNFYYQDSFFKQVPASMTSCPFHSKSLGDV